MIKKTVKYEDLFGRHVEEDCYFNMTETELMALEFSEKDGWSTYIDNVIKAENARQAHAAMSDFVLTAYGEREEDGRGFRKSNEIRERFKSSLAFNEIVLGFVENPDSAAKFVESLVPKNMQERITKMAGREEDTVAAPTRPVTQDHKQKQVSAVEEKAESDDLKAFEAWKAAQENG